MFSELTFIFKPGNKELEWLKFVAVALIKVPRISRFESKINVSMYELMDSTKVLRALTISQFDCKDL